MASVVSPMQPFNPVEEMGGGGGGIKRFDGEHGWQVIKCFLLPVMLQTKHAKEHYCNIRQGHESKNIWTNLLYEVYKVRVAKH